MAFPVLINYQFEVNDNFIGFGIRGTLFFLPNEFRKFLFIDTKGFIPTAALSYIIQSNNGIFFRFSFTPFYYEKKFIPFGGFSFGYSF